MWGKTAKDFKICLYMYLSPLQPTVLQGIKHLSLSSQTCKETSKNENICSNQYGIAI